MTSKTFAFAFIIAVVVITTARQVSAQDGSQTKQGSQANATESADKTGDTKKPNIVVFLADDMGWGDSATYGNKIIKTPNLINSPLKA